MHHEAEGEAAAVAAAVAVAAAALAIAILQSCAKVASRGVHRLGTVVLSHMHSRLVGKLAHPTQQRMLRQAPPVQRPAAHAAGLTDRTAAMGQASGILVRTTRRRTP